LSRRDCRLGMAPGAASSSRSNRIRCGPTRGLAPSTARSIVMLTLTRSRSRSSARAEVQHPCTRHVHDSRRGFRVLRRTSRATRARGELRIHVPSSRRGGERTRVMYVHCSQTCLEGAVRPGIDYTRTHFYARVRSCPYWHIRAHFMRTGAFALCASHKVGFYARRRLKSTPSREVEPLPDETAKQTPSPGKSWALDES